MSNLNKPVLVLNKLWMAINVITIRRAMTLLWKEKAKIIWTDEGFSTFTWEDWSQLRPKDGESFINSSSMTFKIPEVIVLDDYDKFPIYKVKFSRRAMYKRDNFTCMYCGIKPGPELLNIDHVVPCSRNGKTTWENCCCCCIKCNNKKKNHTPAEVGLKLRKNLVKPKFYPFKADSKTAPKSWENFISDLYWSIELQNDN